MGGEITVTSTFGQGSTFEFTVPLKAGSALPVPNAPKVVTQPGALTALPAAACLRVLLVEDHPINQKLAISLIERAGHQVTLAQNGEEGLRAVMQQAFDLVFMDMQMPVMDGLEATRSIRAFEIAQGRPRLPVVAMTANAMDSDRQACADAGMDDFLSKPFKADSLRQILDHHLAQLKQA
jgi:CheY-like chemotaxis protein